MANSHLFSPPVIPAKAGIQKPTTSSPRKRGQDSRPKTSANRGRQIHSPFSPPVIPAKAGIQRPTTSSPRKRGQDSRPKSGTNRARQIPSPFFPPSFPRRRESRRRRSRWDARERDMSVRFCQNQDLRDYRIFRILPARASSVGKRFVLAGFTLIAKTASWRIEILKILILTNTPRRKRSSSIVLAEFTLIAKIASERIKILKIPPILKILILTNTPRRKPPLRRRDARAPRSDRRHHSFLTPLSSLLSPPNLLSSIQTPKRGASTCSKP